MQLSNKQQEFINLLSSGKNIFLTGKAGTGKSFIVKEAMANLTAAGKRFIGITPTGVAANNIGGQTIHSIFSIRPFGVSDFDSCNFLKTEKRRLFDKVDAIFIDEISMLRPDILDAMHWTLIKNGCAGLDKKQTVFIGDLKQLPAVLDDNTRSVLYQNYDGEEFYNAKIYNTLNVINIELDEILRQSDSEFIESLNIVRNGGKSKYFEQFVSKEPNGIVLAPHNSTVQKYNTDGLAKLPTKEIIFEAFVEGNVKADDFNLESIVKVKDGAKIMYLANSKDAPLVNGTLGIFRTAITAEGETHFIEVAGGISYPLRRMKFTKIEYVLSDKKDKLELKELGSIEQYPIKLAYALSIHKSQGLTFDEITVDLSLPCFSKGQMYVALSRVTSPKGLRIITK